MFSRQLIRDSDSPYQRLFNAYNFENSPPRSVSNISEVRQSHFSHPVARRVSTSIVKLSAKTCPSFIFAHPHHHFSIIQSICPWSFINRSHLRPHQFFRFIFGPVHGNARFFVERPFASRSRLHDAASTTFLHRHPPNLGADRLTRYCLQCSSEHVHYQFSSLNENIKAISAYKRRRTAQRAMYLSPISTSSNISPCKGPCVHSVSVHLVN